MGDHEFVNTQDDNGNTILHLAVADKQIRTINFLLFNTTIEVNASNTKGETSMDILARGPSDIKDQQIIRFLTRAGVGAVDAKNENLFEQNPQNSRSILGFDKPKYHKKPHVNKGSKSEDDWLDNKRNALMVVASMIATMAFSAGINPPGGVWQDNEIGVAGQAVMGHKHPNIYKTFLVCNTMGFVSTLSIILLLISELPVMKNRVLFWVQIVIMWIAAASMSLTYLVSIWALKTASHSKLFSKIVVGIVLAWIVLMTILVTGHAVRLMEKWEKAEKQSISRKKAILESSMYDTPYFKITS